MEVFFRLWPGIHLMPGVGATNPDEQLVLGCDMPDNVALAFAAILAADELGDQTVDRSGHKSKKSCRAHQHVLRRAMVRIDDGVGEHPQAFHLPLSGVRGCLAPSHAIVGPSIPLTKPSLKRFRRGS